MNRTTASWAIGRETRLSHTPDRYLDLKMTKQHPTDPRWSTAFRAGLLLGVLTALQALSQVQDRDVEGAAVSPPEWLACLDGDLRQLVHATAGQVPALPAEAGKWTDRKDWPAAITIDGAEYQMCLEATSAPGGSCLDLREISALSDLRPGEGWAAYYRRPDPNGKVNYLVGGPFYAWRSDGTLLERSHGPTTKKGTRSTWSYYHDGKLFQFLCRRDGTALTEYFGPEGGLRGFYLTTQSPDQPRREVRCWGGYMFDGGEPYKERQETFFHEVRDLMNPAVQQPREASLDEKRR